MVFRVYAEKKPGFDVEAAALFTELSDVLQLRALEGVRIVNRYDVEGIDEGLFERSIPTVFSEPQVDRVYRELPDACGATVFAVEYLPGQFDQRADSASECIQLISCEKRPTVAYAKLYYLQGALSQADIDAVKSYVINPIEAREASLAEKDTLEIAAVDPADIEVVEGFCAYDADALRAFIAERGLAMDVADIEVFQAYFRDEEKRDPTITEVKVVDTYWSDHCRHTTFNTELDCVEIGDAIVQAAFDRYLEIRRELGREDKPVCLMDLGTIGARYLKHTGELVGLDESEEINACTVKVKVDVDGSEEDWLFLFKNETHNHPTEVEPFGGAATCIGGCIRDPLSGRAYVYQAMRVTGAADPRTPVEDTIEGKLPQRKIVVEAAAGYSSYGNQIGLATGQVTELYHPGYAAKRMEIGAVVGAAPADHVRRETPLPGDKIVLLGGRTGRDGIGGATGSSKAHNVESIEDCGAEVQKGNAPIERKLQRLFRRGEACRLIKRCNDFGAGGVSVACGEIADGLTIELDAVPKKYAGLDGTELAISESQERMACAVAADDVEAFTRYAHEENLEACVVATVTEEPRVKMMWRGSAIVDISRAFLDENGAAKHARVRIEGARSYEVPEPWREGSLRERLAAVLGDINVASNKGLSERFDSTVGAGAVLMPFGGKRQLTPAMAMVSRLPVKGRTRTVSCMAFGFNPYIMSADPFSGAYLSVVESVSRLYAAGFSKSDRHGVYLTFQEYFGKLRDVPERWGKPAAALLGALSAQLDLGIGAIGGKDSMSGSFEDRDVPPTLVSFAASTGPMGRVVSPEFKSPGHRVVLLAPRYRSAGAVGGAARWLPQSESLRDVLGVVRWLAANKLARAISTPGYGGIAEALFKMCVGNGIGLHAPDACELGLDELFCPAYGSFIVELVDENQEIPAAEGEESPAFDIVELGHTIADYELVGWDEVIDLAELQELWEGVLEDVFPYRSAGGDGAREAGSAGGKVEAITDDSHVPVTYNGCIPKPRVVIPVFPGTNCEYDTQSAFERAGAQTSIFVVNTLDPSQVTQSVERLVAELDQAQILMLPGGFSGGDEPEGSAKLIAAFFRNPYLTEAVRRLLNDRDGLILGICNGFQALVKLGLLPFGDIRDMDEDCTTLTFNTIGRHQSRIVRTRVASNLSPWLSRCKVGGIHTMPISHGEGRFVAPQHVLDGLRERGQIATQYVGLDGEPSMGLDVNPNGSMLAIEGVTSPDGRIFGKMGHTERIHDGLYKNIPAYAPQPLIEGGVGYFGG